LPAGSCPLALSGSGKPLTQGYSSESFPSTMGMLHELLRRTGRVEAVDTALFFRRFPVPYWAIASVFGRDALSWYR
jgi:hypothetical protein